MFIKFLHINCSNAFLLIYGYLYLIILLVCGNDLFDLTEKICRPDELRYRYTECDENGQRWRYATPRSHQIKCRNIPPPISGLNCCKI